VRTGWIGAHIAHEALAAGLNLKLAIRSESKAKTIIEALEKIHGSGHIEIVIVKDFGAENAYDEAVLGVQGIIHAASDLSFSDKVDEVIPPVIKAYNSLLTAAKSQEQIRRFILTSSSAAMGFPNPGGNETHKWDVNTWNEASLEAIKSPSPSGVAVYAASKVLSERAAWDFVKRENPNFIITTINPNANFGAPVPGIPISSTGQWIVDAAIGKTSTFEYSGSQWHVDVEDVAKLHVIALMKEDVKNERIPAFGSVYTYNSVIDAIKRVKPDAATPEKKKEWDVTDNTVIDVSRANELLKDQGGLRDLDYSVKGNLSTL
jgi:nucleoside-diphosphate-sugar epimerase